MTNPHSQWPYGSPVPLDMPHIAILGKAGSGKTTGAKLLDQRFGYGRAAFASLLKEVATLIWGTSAQRDRDKLQRLGVAVRDIDEGAWVSALEARINDWRCPIVIDDCRFLNEYWALKHRGFKFIRVHAREDIRQARLMRNGKFTSNEQFLHISETALDGIDADLGLVNEGTLEEFEGNLLDIVERLRRETI